MTISPIYPSSHTFSYPISGSSAPSTETFSYPIRDSSVPSTEGFTHTGGPIRSASTNRFNPSGSTFPSLSPSHLSSGGNLLFTSAPPTSVPHGLPAPQSKPFFDAQFLAALSTDDRLKALLGIQPQAPAFDPHHEASVHRNTVIPPAQPPLPPQLQPVTQRSVPPLFFAPSPRFHSAFFHSQPTGYPPVSLPLIAQESVPSLSYPPTAEVAQTCFGRVPNGDLVKELIGRGRARCQIPHVLIKEQNLLYSYACTILHDFLKSSEYVNNPDFEYKLEKNTDNFNKEIIKLVGHITDKKERRETLQAQQKSDYGIVIAEKTASHWINRALKEEKKAAKMYKAAISPRTTSTQ